MKKISALLTLMLGALMLSGTAFAAEANESHEKMTMGAFEHKVVDNGVRAEFQIMSLAQMNMKDAKGATHHVMVRLFQDETNRPITEAEGKIKVIGPDQKSQVADLENYNGVFAAKISFSQKGKYGVICLVKINEKKHLFKFWYHNM